MHNTSLTLLKWIFIAVGLGLLVIAIVVPDEAKWLLTLLGLMFTGVGGGILFVGERNAKRAAWLLQHGQRIDAELREVELNTSFQVNGRHPYRAIVEARAGFGRELRQFRSANIWFDPTRHLSGRRIAVYVDPANPKRYHVDLSFLPPRG